MGLSAFNQMRARQSELDKRLEQEELAKQEPIEEECIEDTEPVDMDDEEEQAKMEEYLAQKEANKKPVRGRPKKD